MQESFFPPGVSARVVRVLERRGITAPFAVQQLVLPDALAGLDVLAASPTSRRCVGQRKRCRQGHAGERTGRQLHRRCRPEGRHGE